MVRAVIWIVEFTKYHIVHKVFHSNVVNQIMALKYRAEAVAVKVIDILCSTCQQ